MFPPMSGSPLTSTSVPPPTEEYPTAPLVWVGSESPIEVHDAPSFPDIHTPPVPMVAKSRPFFSS